MKFSRFVIDQRICRQCGSCARACPQAAVKETSDKRFVIDQDHCDGCGACRDACKLRAIVKRKGLFL